MKEYTLDQIEMALCQIAKEFIMRKTNIRSVQIDKEGVVIILQDMRPNGNTKN